MEGIKAACMALAGFVSGSQSNVRLQSSLEGDLDEGRAGGHAGPVSGGQRWRPQRVGVPLAHSPFPSQPTQHDQRVLNLCTGVAPPTHRDTHASLCSRAAMLLQTLTALPSLWQLVLDRRRGQEAGGGAPPGRRRRRHGWVAAARVNWQRAQPPPTVSTASVDSLGRPRVLKVDSQLRGQELIR